VSDGVDQRTIIDILKKDHSVVADLHSQFQTQRDPFERQRLANELIRSLSIHDAIEGMVLYPHAQKRLGDSAANKPLDQHRKVREDLYRLDQMKVEDSGYDSLLNSIMTAVTQHVHEEETQLFPRLEAADSVADLQKLGERIQMARKAAPTRPHPSAPDTMPGIAIAGALAAPIDRLHDQGREFRKSSVEPSSP